MGDVIKANKDFTPLFKPYFTFTSNMGGEKCYTAQKKCFSGWFDGLNDRWEEVKSRSTEVIRKLLQLSCRHSHISEQSYTYLPTARCADGSLGYKYYSLIVFKMQWHDGTLYTLTAVLTALLIQINLQMLGGESLALSWMSTEAQIISSFYSRAPRWLITITTSVYHYRRNRCQCCRAERYYFVITLSDNTFELRKEDGKSCNEWNYSVQGEAEEDLRNQYNFIVVVLFLELIKFSSFFLMDPHTQSFVMGMCLAKVV